MGNSINGIFIIVGGALLQGSFALFLKYRYSWRWENFWLVYSFIALIAFPFVWTSAVVPNFGNFLLSLPFSLVFLPIIFGAAWGVGSVLFGLAVERIGMAITFTIVIGLSAAIGSVIPLFLNASFLSITTLLFFAIGLVIVVAGILASGYAGLLREKIQQLMRPTDSQSYASGLAMAIVSGIFSPMNNVGFAYGTSIREAAMKFGASPSDATLPILLIVLFGGFLINAGYAVFLLLKNKSFGAFFAPSGIKSLAGSITSGIFWFGGIGLYGIATVYLGKLGTSVGYVIFIGFVILVSNVLGVMMGEWRGAGKAGKVQAASMCILVVGIVITSFSFFGA